MAKPTPEQLAKRAEVNLRAAAAAKRDAATAAAIPPTPPPDDGPIVFG